MSTYNINQAGAAGDDAQSHNAIFNQVINKAGNQTEGWLKLVEELSKLHDEMSIKASKPEHHDSIKAIILAEQAAKEQNRSKTLQYVKDAGLWVLDIAKAIGIPITIEVIKKANGLM